MDGTLAQIKDAMTICGEVPRENSAALSSGGLSAARNKITAALRDTKDIADAIHQTVRNEPVPHSAFLVCPGPGSRRWVDAIVQPVSQWALERIIVELQSRARDAAFRLYMTIQGTPEAAAFRGRIWEWQVHVYFSSFTQPRTLPIRPTDNRSAATVNMTFCVKNQDTFGRPAIFEGSLASYIRDGDSGYLMPCSKVYATFDAFLYQHGVSLPGHLPLIGLQITDAYDHPINPKGLELLRKSLNHAGLKHLVPSDQNRLIILFVVPKPMAASWMKQRFKDSDGKFINSPTWDRKTTQYVVELDPEEVWAVRK